MVVVMDKYMTRIADKVIAERLEAKGAIIIEGPKWCGKTDNGKTSCEKV